MARKTKKNPKLNPIARAAAQEHEQESYVPGTMLDAYLSGSEDSENNATGNGTEITDELPSLNEQELKILNPEPQKPEGEKEKTDGAKQNDTSDQISKDENGYVDDCLSEKQPIVLDQANSRMQTKAGIKRNSPMTRSQRKLTAEKVSKLDRENKKKTDNSPSTGQIIPQKFVAVKDEDKKNILKSQNKTKKASTPENNNGDGLLPTPPLKLDNVNEKDTVNSQLNRQRALQNGFDVNSKNQINPSKLQNKMKEASTPENINGNGLLPTPKSESVKGKSKRTTPYNNVARNTRSSKKLTASANENHLNNISSPIEKNILTTDKNSTDLEPKIIPKTQSPIDKVSVKKEKIDEKELGKEKIDEKELGKENIKNKRKEEAFFSTPTIPKKEINSSDAQLIIDMQKLHVKDDQDNKRRRLSHCIVINEEVTEEAPLRRSARNNRPSPEEIMNEIRRKVTENIEEGLEVAEFGVKGKGVVTTKDFSKGEFVVEYHGELIDNNEAKKREKKYSKNKRIGCYMFYFQYKNSTLCVDATKDTGRCGRLLNHSQKNKNLKPEVIEIRGKPHIILYACKDIPAGTELLYDYGDRSKESLAHFAWLLE
ncbi:N-lysine methyltransferase KMT5A-like [Trichogramma pretiosum]|uniref:N-lysine methyltransferase KMT5A-like n=1 Tax=Trichogramma pretiosum TaxID=7493 RepID=UPI0006C98531|nr:N-lysine methyltransferase KMT5A-like [Trichogramma pretiosum]